MPEYITANELAKRLGVTRGGIHFWIKSGFIPPDYVLRLGHRTVRIRADIIAYLQNPKPAA